MQKWLFAVLVSAAFLAAPDFARSDSLFGAPPRGGTPSPPAAQPAESVLTLTALVPYAALQRIGDARMPAAVPLSGSGSAGCLDLLGSKQCADYHWSAEVQKDGPFGVSRAETQIRLTQPLHILGKVGVGGDLAKAAKLDARNIDLRLVAVADVHVDMDPRWRPIVSLSPQGRWVENAEVEIIGKSCVKIDLGFVRKSICFGPVNAHVASLLNELLDRRRDDLGRAATNAIPSDKIRARIAQTWKPMSIALPVADGPPLYLNVTPERAAFSGLSAEPDGVRLTVRVSAAASFSPSAASSDPLPLPPLEKVDLGAGGFRTLVNLDASYDLLKQQLSQRLTGKEFQRQTPLGDLDIRIEDVDIYPSGTSLALGLRIAGKGPAGVPDAAGWVYLTGRPVASASGTQVKIEDLQYSAVTDSAFWNWAQVLLQGVVLDDLRTRAEFDLSPKIEQADAKWAKAAAKANIAGVKLSVSQPKIALTNVTVAPDGIAATATITANFGIDVSAALIGD